MAETILNNFTSTVRKAVDEYHMIEEGDKIAVGISGGKDSMLLLASLHHLSTFYPYHFDVEAVTIDLEQLVVPEIVFDIRKEDNPCALCAKMRRGALNNIIKTHGFTKLALGHHFDDAVETFMLSLVFEGRLTCFRPVTYMDRSGVTQIRPLIYAGEQRITNVAKLLDLPIVENPCPMDKNSKRYEIKNMLREMSKDYPDLKTKVFGALQRYPMPGWEPDRNRREYE